MEGILYPNVPIYLIITPDEIEILRENNLLSEISLAYGEDMYEVSRKVEEFLAENVWTDLTESDD